VQKQSKAKNAVTTSTLPSAATTTPSSSRHLLAHSNTHTNSRTRQRLSKLSGLSTLQHTHNTNVHTLNPDSQYAQRENEFEREAELAQWEDERIKLKALAAKEARDFKREAQADSTIASVLGLGLDSSSGDTWGAGWSAGYNNGVTPPDGGDQIHGTSAWVDVSPAAGWALIMSIGATALFDYDSLHWTTNSVYPSNQDGTIYDADGNAKFDGFNTLPFSQIRLCIEEETNCITTTLSTVYTNALQLFQSDTVAQGVNTTDFYSVFQPWSQPPCAPLHFGFNVLCPNVDTTKTTPTGSAVRWGFCAQMPPPQPTLTCANVATDSGVIGLGLRSITECCQTGAGYTNNFVYNKPNPVVGTGTGLYTGLESAERAWLYVRPLSGLSKTS